MPSVDNTPPTTLTESSKMKTVQEPQPRDWLTGTETWTSESYATGESQHLSKGNPSGPSSWQPCKPHGTVDSEHSRKGQKRKCQAEGEKDVHSEKRSQLFKRLKTLMQERAFRREEPGKGQVRKPQKEGESHLKPTECTKSPGQEAVTEVKPLDGGKGPKSPYFNMEEGVQKHHSGMYPSLVVPLQHSDSASSDFFKSHRIPVEASEKINVCVDEQIPASERPQTCTDRGSNKMPIPKAKEKTPEDQDKSTGLDHGPLITEDMQKEISSALGPGPQDEVLSRAFNMTITRGDMWTLRDTHWLNDTVINFYMNLLMARNQSQAYPALYTFNTFFYPKLKTGGYRAVRRWTKAVNLFAKDLILVPIHQGVHWSLVVTDLRDKSLVYLDSRGRKRPDVLQLIFHYLQDESQARRNVELNPLEWKQYSMAAEDIPQQGNGSDCGMFTCKYADYMSRGQPMSFSQQHMPLFRKKMVWEILHQCLL